MQCGRQASGNVQYFIVFFEDARDGLEVQALKRVAVLGMKLNDVVVEAPVFVLERDGLVDMLDELRYCWVVVQGNVEKNPGFW